MSKVKGRHLGTGHAIVFGQRTSSWDRASLVPRPLSIFPKEVWERD